MNRYAPVTAAPPSEPASRAPSFERSGTGGTSDVSRNAGGGSSITVERGDTLYGLSRRHGVSVADLKSANGLNSNMLRVGQQLVVPGRGSGSVRHSGPVGVSESGAPRLEPRSASRHASSMESSASGGSDPSPDGDTYVVKSGDSLYQIARANNMRLAELQRINGISNPRKVRPGTVLKLRGGAEVGPTVRHYGPRVATVKTVTTTDDSTPRGYEAPAAPRVEPATVAPSSGGTYSHSGTPRIINGENAGQQAQPNVRHANAVAAPASAAPVANAGALDSGAFRWPATGRIVSAFGPRPDGSHNDGINILVPLGTPVHAAEAGTVAYAGNELEGYGNLVLIRHSNGWVSAYAHNDAVLVKQGDTITRGQVIAKAGKTGTVDQPQIHFELRDGARPVDPRQHLAKI